MKWFLLLVFVPALVSAQEKRFTITGKIDGAPDNTMISLIDMNDATDTLSAASIKNNTFEMKGTMAQPSFYKLHVEGGGNDAVLFIGNEKIGIEGSYDNVSGVKVTGSKFHQDFRDFETLFNPLYMKLQEMNKELSAMTPEQRTDSVMQGYEAHVDKIIAAIDQFVTEKKSSPIAAFTLYATRQLDQDPDNLERRFNALSQEVQQSFFGKIIHDEITKSKVGAIGTQAIAFTQNDPEGKPVSLDSFRGKYVLVDFWASWCKPCRMENPNVVSAFNRFKDKNFTVLGISLDKSKEDWVAAIRQDGLSWTHTSDLRYWQNEVAMKYNIQSIPQNFLIDPKGVIVAKNLRGEALQDKLCDLLGCN